MTLYCLQDLPVKGLKYPRPIDYGHGEEAEVRTLLVGICVEHRAGPNLSLSSLHPTPTCQDCSWIWGGPFLLPLVPEIGRSRITLSASGVLCPIYASPEEVT